MQLDTLGLDGWWRLSGNVWMDSRIWEGRGQRSDGTWVEWSAIRQSEPRKRPLRIKPSPIPCKARSCIRLWLTATLNGRLSARCGSKATVWTCEATGKLEQADVVIHNGKILAVGEALDEASVFGSNVPPTNALMPVNT